MVEVAAAGIEHHVHVGDLALHQLELADGLTKLFALVDVWHHFVHTGLHHAYRAPGKNGALVIQSTHQYFHTLVFLAEDVFGGDFAVFEHQLAGVGATHAQFVQLLSAGEAREITLDDERRDASGACIAVSLGVDHIGMGVRAVGNPHLVAIEDVAVAFLFGAQLHADHIGPGTGLAHGQGTDMVTADQFGQVPGFLLVGTVDNNLVDAQVGVGAVGETDRRRSPGNFLYHNGVGQVAHVGAAVFFVSGNAQQAQIAHFFPQRQGELIAAVDFGGQGGNFFLGKGTGRITERIDSFAQMKIESAVEHYCVSRS